MVTVTWAAAAEVIIMDGAADVVITTAGHAVDTTTIETEQEAAFWRPPAHPDFAAGFGDLRLNGGIEDQSVQQR
jgi:hypothetical protein